MLRSFILKLIKFVNWYCGTASLCLIAATFKGAAFAVSASRICSLPWYQILGLDREVEHYLTLFSNLRQEHFKPLKDTFSNICNKANYKLEKKHITFKNYICFQNTQYHKNLEGVERFSYLPFPQSVFPSLSHFSSGNQHLLTLRPRQLCPRRRFSPCSRCRRWMSTTYVHPGPSRRGSGGGTPCRNVRTSKTEIWHFM